MKHITLTRGMSAVIDDADFEWISQWKWHAAFNRNAKSWYAVRSDRKSLTGKVFMHRVITGCPLRKIIDHANHNTLDNRRLNLRVSTFEENSRNRKRHSNNKSGFKGVSLRGDAQKWVAHIWQRGKSIYLGCFLTAELAALAYDKAAKESYGDFAFTNFP